MIINAKELLEQAKIEKSVIFQFNIHNLEWTRYILEECNRLESPVILGVSESSIQYMGGYQIVVNLVKSLVKELNINIPVVIHLDHGSSFDSCVKAIDAGFTSVMIDVSKYDMDINIDITKQVVCYAKKNHVTVEAEIGVVGKNNQLEKKAYAKVEDAIWLVKKTDIDFLAPAVGNCHGIYQGEVKLDFDLIKQISEQVNIPLVLHGGTGINDEDLKLAVQSGICKVNINTELQIAWSNSVREFLNTTSEYDPRKIIQSGEKAIKQVVKNKISVIHKK